MTQLAEGRDSSLIVPLIKRTDAEGSGDPPPWPVPEADIPIFEELTGYLLVAYVFDLPDRFEYVTPRHCEQLELAAEDLRPLAVRNLTQRRAKPQIRQGGGIASFLLDGSLESSLLLVDHVWWQITPHVAGDLVAAVPSRDTLLVTGSDFAGGMAALERGADYVWQKSETRLLLTKFFLIRRGDSWEQFHLAGSVTGCCW